MASLDCRKNATPAATLAARLAELRRLCLKRGVNGLTQALIEKLIQAKSNIKRSAAELSNHLIEESWAPSQSRMQVGCRHLAEKN